MRPVPTFVATYAYTDDADARSAARPEHRAWLGTLPQLIASGPTDAEGAVLVLEADSAQEVERLLDDDPFAVRGGIVAERRVVGWTVVSGRLAGAFGGGAGGAPRT